ncbi:cupin domain-containing protein [Nonomuraea sp. NPDC046570]|uniref:cupin domain-containing protein n=1 Tax=Nonomuraea sp. NPDC046570 TaxID=3155255 RepID=UPI0033D85233
MPVVKGATAPVFELPTATFTGLAAPSRGAKETSVWRTLVKPGAEPGPPHSFDHEEVLVAIRGRAYALLDGVRHDVAEGDAVIVPAGTLFGLGNPYDEPFELVAALPVGAMATMPDGEVTVPFTAR